MVKFNSSVIEAQYSSTGAIGVTTLFQFDEKITRVLYPLMLFAINTVIQYHTYRDGVFLKHIENEFSKLYYNVRLEINGLSELYNIQKGTFIDSLNERGMCVM